MAGVPREAKLVGEAAQGRRARPRQMPNAIPSLRYISRISLEIKAISGDLSPLRVLMMIGEKAFSSSSGRYATLSRRRPSTEIGTRQTPTSAATKPRAV